MRTRADAERWGHRLYEIMGDIQRVEGEGNTSDLENMVRFAWLEARRELELMEEHQLLDPLARFPIS